MRRLPITYLLSAVMVLTLTAFANFNTNTPIPRSATVNEFTDFEAKAEAIYENLKSDHMKLPQMKSFSKALKGFYKLKESGKIKKDILTIVDFSLPSTSKRLWVIDLSNNEILYNSLVAHGIKTGENNAKSFSNDHRSYKSSLGFYTTGETYNGKNGFSLRLDGLEKGINSNARARGVVIHAASYVSEAFIRQNNRLGRSQGCPALPSELSQDIINVIKNKSCLFIYHPSLKSKLLRS